ncbi:agglutination protein [Photobacterium gaetbulicola]|uniref:Putative agglutination protein n=1 Tax=Photobacterium gaetbulicola Gung47 TaxID=658445 RepID=A0A0C5WH04_9GAMM|nr:TolC family outer membrane protein [Photobacterium gaetbulicola]AJR06408.1 putative agglutination protein [Photobacterium gaetbulicola Gung47]PSU05503.1 agglutination protein [Photobacterium gaetbulicola]
MTTIPKPVLLPPCCLKLTLIVSLLLAPNAIGQSLEQAVADTLTTNPEIKRAYNAFMSLNQATRSAVGDYLPSVDLETSVGYEDYDNSTNSTGDYEPLDASISLRQLIWDGSITYHDIQRNKAEAEAQRYQLLADAQDKALRVTEIYLNTLEAQEVLTLSQSNYAVHQRIFTDIKKRTDSGIGSTADLAQIEGRLARSRSNLIAAENNLQDKITEFYREVGSNPVNLEKPEVDQNYIPTSLDNALNQAKDNNPVLFVAKNDIDAANYQYKQAKGNFYPTFSIEASQEWGEDLDGTPGHTDEFKAMLKMEYNLYNGGSDLADSRRAAYQLSQSKDVRDRAYRLLEESTRLAWSGMELALSQTQYLQQHVDASARTVIAYEKQFKIGKRTLLDVLNTENELFEARKAYLGAHYAGILAKYRVLNATGQLLEEMRVDVPSQWSESVR